MTELVEEIARSSGTLLLRRRDTVFVSAHDAVPFLKRARDADVRVLGAEGFRITDQRIEPAMEAILDLSEMESAPRALEAAISFASQFDDSDLWFEFTIVPG